MPSGVYKRSAQHIEKMKKNLVKGHSPEARAKATATLKKIASNEEWRKRVSKATRKAMHKPATRKRHLQGLERALEKHGVRFKGGNGQPPTKTVKRLERILSPHGFKREVAIKTRNHTTKYIRVPACYKVDFGHLLFKFAIEVDGPSHRNMKARRKERKKTAILESLGWTVVRLIHD